MCTDRIILLTRRSAGWFLQLHNLSFWKSPENSSEYLSAKFVDVWVSLDIETEQCLESEEKVYEFDAPVTAGEMTAGNVEERHVFMHTSTGS